MDDSCSSFASDNLETELETAENFEIDPFERMFKSKLSQDKYKSFVKVSSISQKAKKRKLSDVSGDLNAATTSLIAGIECFTCNKTFFAQNCSNYIDDLFQLWFYRVLPVLKNKRLFLNSTIF